MDTTACSQDTTVMQKEVNKMRKIEAMKNLKKAAENGPTSFATTLPAMNVPPQKMAVSMSLTYTIIIQTFLYSPGKCLFIPY